MEFDCLARTDTKGWVFATPPSSHVRNSIRGMSGFFITLDFLWHLDWYRPMASGIKIALDLTTAKSLPVYATNFLGELDFAIGQLRYCCLVDSEQQFALHSVFRGLR